MCIPDLILKETVPKPHKNNGKDKEFEENFLTINRYLDLVGNMQMAY